jgi:hypothetical protein
MQDPANINVLHKPHQCGRSWVQAQVGSNQRLYTIGIRCFCAKHAALRRKSKNWLVLNQDNVFDWGDMSILGRLFHST